MIDGRGKRQDTKIGAWMRRQFFMRQWCAGAVSLIGLFDMPFTCHGNEKAYKRRFYILFRRHCGRSGVNEGLV